MNRKVIIILAVVILFILFPLLTPGYLLSLDWVTPLTGEIPAWGANAYRVLWGAKLFSFVRLPVWILEKLIFLFVLIVPVWGIYLIVKKTSNNYSILYACLMMIFNPFLYGRFIDGQLGVVMSYACYPLFLFVVDGFFSQPSYKRFGLVLAISLVLSGMMIHNLVFIGLIIAIWLILYRKNLGFRQQLYVLLTMIALMGGGWYVLSTPYAAELTKQMQNFSSTDQKRFQTLSSPLNSYVSVVSLHGYRGEAEKRFMSAWQYNPFWYIVFSGIFLLSLLGIVYRLKEKKLGTFDYGILLLGLCSLILSLGTADTIFAYFNTRLYTYLPGYQGMREPHKWIQFLVIFYAYFGAWGTAYLSEYIQKRNKNNTLFITSVLWFFALMPILYVPRTLWGFSQQITISAYPDERKQTQQLYKDRGRHTDISENCIAHKHGTSTKCYTSLAFPRHHYMYISFANKIVLGSIVGYFTPHILSADNLEIGSIYSRSSRPESKIIEHYIGPEGVLKKDYTHDDLQAFVTDLKTIGISTVLILKESDYLWYAKILETAKQFGLVTILTENNKLSVYMII